MSATDKIELSFSTMNTLIHCPHTWLNKINKLKKFENPYMQQGRDNHKILQESVSGVKPHELLKKLPLFELVETEDFDPKMKFTFEWSEKYRIFGYADGFNTEKTNLLEFKSGRKWTAGDFARLPQWKIEALCIPTIKTAWFVSAPIDPKNWTAQNITVNNTDVTEKHKEEAKAFIQKAIDIIESINDQELFVESRSRFCYFINCPWGCSTNGHA